MWTVYCMGDLPIFSAVINAIAMVFSSSLFNPTMGAGLVVVAMLISLLLFALPTLMGKPLSPTPLIFVFLVYFGGIVPKVTLQVQDMVSGAVTVIDNVPVIVAAPASIAAAISKGITETTETAFSMVGTSTYLGLGAEGFANPLKILLSFRAANTAPKIAPHFTNTLSAFMSNCAINSTNFSGLDLRNATDSITYLTTLNDTGNLTLKYNTANPQGILDTCGSTLSDLVNEAATITTSPMTDKFINSAVTPTASSPGGNIALTNAYNNITSQILGNAQNSQQFMVNMLASQTISNGMKCGNASTPGDLAACQEKFTSATALEQANMDGAANASIFAKVAISLSNILLALFYAFSPIVLGVALMSGAHGIKIVGGFLMFGAWTQSWMPIAAVLNFMVQAQAQYEVSKLGSQGVTIENASSFYNLISMKVGLASELFAMTPMISFALLSGSMMSLSAVAGKMGKDRVDEKQMAPGQVDNSSLVSNGAPVASKNAVNMDRLTDQTAGGPMAKDGGSLATGSKIGLNNALTDATNKSNTRMESISNEHAQQAISDIREQMTKGTTKAETEAKTAAFNRQHADAKSWASAQVAKMDKGNTMSEAHKKGMKLAFEAGALGLSGGVTEAMDVAQQYAESHGLSQQYAESKDHTNSSAQAFANNYSKNVTEDQSKALARSLAKSNSEATRRIKAEQSAMAQMRQNASSISGGKEMTTNQVAAMVASSAALEEAMGISGNSQYQEAKAAAEQSLMRLNHAGGGSLSDQERSQAMLMAASTTDGEALLRGVNHAGLGYEGSGNHTDHTGSDNVSAGSVNMAGANSGSVDYSSVGSVGGLTRHQVGTDSAGKPIYKTEGTQAMAVEKILDQHTAQGSNASITAHNRGKADMVAGGDKALDEQTGLVNLVTGSVKRR